MKLEPPSIYFALSLAVLFIKSKKLNTILFRKLEFHDHSYGLNFQMKVL